MFLKKCVPAWALALGLVATGPTLAQSVAFPTQPIRLVVGFPAGGASDVAARAIASQMTTQLGQQVIVENKPGAASNIGAEFVAKSKPDG